MTNMYMYVVVYTISTYKNQDTGLPTHYLGE